MNVVPPALGTATERLEWCAAHIGSREFVVWSDRGTTTTYAEMFDLAARWAGMLAARGVQRGDRVMILLPNRVEFLGAHFGAQFLGAIPVPINTELRGESLRHPLTLFEPAVVVVAAALHELLKRAAGEDEPFATIVVSSDYSLEHELATVEPMLPIHLDAADASLIMSTSGTTGPPKGTVWNYGTLETWAEGYRIHLELDATDRVFSCTPLFHANSLCTGVMAVMNAGATMILAERFSVSRFWADVVAHGATTTPLIGAMIELLVKTETPAMRADRERSPLRKILGACPPSTHSAVVEKWGITPVSAYGLTDFGTMTFTSYGTFGPAGSVGRVIDDFEVKLVDADGVEVARGEAGEMLVRPRRPDTTPLGYFRMPEATLASRADLWFHTGDLLRQDAEGWFFFAGRVKDSMRRRGENVSAFEVELAAMSFPAVSEVAAYPVPAGDGDEEIAIAIVVHPERELIHSDLFAHMSAELPYFAVPRFVRVMASLPKTPTQKIQKGPLRDDGVTSDTWDRVAAGLNPDRNSRREDEQKEIEL